MKRALLILISVVVLLALAASSWLVWAWQTPGCVRNGHHAFPRCYNEKD